MSGESITEITSIAGYSSLSAIPYKSVDKRDTAAIAAHHKGARSSILPHPSICADWSLLLKPFEDRKKDEDEDETASQRRTHAAESWVDGALKYRMKWFISAAPHSLPLAWYKFRFRTDVMAVYVTLYYWHLNGVGGNKLVDDFTESVVDNWFGASWSYFFPIRIYKYVNGHGLLILNERFKW